MPRLDGFEVLNELRGKQLPLIIFVTAYEQYAQDCVKSRRIGRYLIRHYECTDDFPGAYLRRCLG